MGASRMGEMLNINKGNLSIGRASSPDGGGEVGVVRDRQGKVAPEGVVRRFPGAKVAGVLHTRARGMKGFGGK